jgi:hypothetical protein
LADKNDSDDDEPDRKRRKLNDGEPQPVDEDEDTFGPRPALANMFSPEEDSENTEEARRIRREKEKKQWEMLRSNTTGSIQTGPSKREDWMTKLPETKKVSLDFDLMQKSVTSFSRKGVDDRGDVTGWTSTPGEEPAAPQLSALELAKQMVAERVAADKERQNREAIEKHSGVNRQKSLMEQHYEKKMQKSEKKDKKGKDKDKKEKKGKDKDKKHKDKKHKDKKDKKDKRDKKDKKDKKKDDDFVPYFDRERDLKVGIIDSKRTAKLLSDNDALLTRFGSSRSSKFL